MKIYLMCLHLEDQDLHLRYSLVKEHQQLGTELGWVQVKFSFFLLVYSSRFLPCSQSSCMPVYKGNVCITLALTAIILHIHWDFLFCGGLVNPITLTLTGSGEDWKPPSKKTKYCIYSRSYRERERKIRKILKKKTDQWIVYLHEILLLLD